MDDDPQALGSGEQTDPATLPDLTSAPELSQTGTPAQTARAGSGRQGKMAPTRASGFWAAVVGGLIVLLVLIVFILQNTDKVHLALFTGHWYIPLGVAMLLAAVIGGLFVVLAGAARILELRRRARAEQRRADAARRARSS